MVRHHLDDAALRLLYLCGVGEHKLDHLLRLLCGLLQEELDSSRDQLQLHKSRFLREGLQELLQELICIVDTLCIFSNDPDHAGLGLGLIQCVQVLAERGNDALVSVPTDTSRQHHVTAAAFELAFASAMQTRANEQHKLRPAIQELQTPFI